MKDHDNAFTSQSVSKVVGADDHKLLDRMLASQNQSSPIERLQQQLHRVVEMLAEGNQKDVLTASEAMQYLRCKNTKFYQLIAAGLIPEPSLVGDKKVWLKSDLREWVEVGCPSQERWNVIKKQKRRR